MPVFHLWYLHFFQCYSSYSDLKPPKNSVSRKYIWSFFFPLKRFGTDLAVVSSHKLAEHPGQLGDGHASENEFICAFSFQNDQIDSFLPDGQNQTKQPNTSNKQKYPAICNLLIKKRIYCLVLY